MPAKRYHQIATPLHLGAVALMWGTGLVFLDVLDHRTLWLLPGP